MDLNRMKGLRMQCLMQCLTTICNYGPGHQRRRSANPNLSPQTTLGDSLSLLRSGSSSLTVDSPMAQPPAKTAIEAPNQVNLHTMYFNPSFERQSETVGRYDYRASSHDNSKIKIADDAELTDMSICLSHIEAAEKNNFQPMVFYPSSESRCDDISRFNRQPIENNTAGAIYRDDPDLTDNMSICLSEVEALDDIDLHGMVPRRSSEHQYNEATRYVSWNSGNAHLGVNNQNYPDPPYKQPSYLSDTEFDTGPHDQSSVDESTINFDQVIVEWQNRENTPVDSFQGPTESELNRRKFETKLR